VSPRLAVIGDVHTHFGYLRRCLAHAQAHEATAVLLVGDLADAGWKLQRTPAKKRRYRAKAAEVLDLVRATGRPTFYVPGNHDLPSLDLPGNIDGTVVELDGLRVAGLGGAGPARFGFAYEWSEATAAGRLRALPDCDVLLAHCPPARTELDRIESGKHVGSEAIRSWVETHAQVMVCGHIHEAASVAQHGDCLCMNVGGLGRPHGRAQLGYIDGRDAIRHVDLDTGTWTTLVRDGEVTTTDADLTTG